MRPIALLILAVCLFAEDITAPPAQEPAAPKIDQPSPEENAKILADLKAKRKAKAAEVDQPLTADEAAADQQRQAFAARVEQEKADGAKAVKERRLESLEKKRHAKAKEVIRLEDKLEARKDAAGQASLNGSRDPASKAALNAPVDAAEEDLKELTAEVIKLKKELGTHLGKKEPTWKEFLLKVKHGEL